MFSFVRFCSCVFQCPGSVNRILWAHSAFLHYLLLPLNGECAIISNVVSTIVKIYQMFVHEFEHFICYLKVDFFNHSYLHFNYHT